MDALEPYLREIRLTRATGAAVKETSYYPALANLFNTVGKTLKPRVHCVINVRNQGAGLPDGGLFTPDQLQAVGDAPFAQGPTPARGVIEAKGSGARLDDILESEQIGRYWDRYGQVLVTNLRDFALVGADVAGDRAVLERYCLAPDDASFWTADPSALRDAHAEPFVQYLSRIMLHAAPLAAPKDVAWFLASYARDAKARVDRADLPALDQIRQALEQALGLRFEGERGERFFRSTLVQTLFYGVFSAWVLWSKKHPPASTARFNWHDAEYELRVPMIRALFEQLAMGSRLRPLGLIEVLDWTAAALNRVDRAAFFAAFAEDAAVQYFYEPFLEAFDPELRKQLGVWYTPPEIVRYMVERVDTVLRDELGLPDGLADPNVYVLDPCTGTGSYLVETLRRIGRTLAEQGDDALAAHRLKRAAMERVVGFEILPAPFVVAHLQLGLLLQDLGAPFADAGDGAHERAGVYLTNALTGWDPDAGPQQPLLFPELEAERDAADEVKRTKPILVVLGNPPYNAFAGVSPAEEDDLVEPYKVGLNTAVAEGGWGIRKFNLDDLYVRFFRLGERRIAEQTGKGVVCYISNFSYLSDPSFVVMRQRFLAEFDALWFDSLNGDSRETGKLTPEGKPDPSVFSTPANREGIRVGTAVGLMVRKPVRDPAPTVRFRQFWGATKRGKLVGSLDANDFDLGYTLG
nr:N-6 DNA methylase [Chloroflexia bacterium]